MQELIQFIRQQLVLCLRLLELLQQQRSALVHTEPAAVGGLTKDIEIVVIDLNRLEKQRQEFLRRHHSGDAAQWLAKQPPRGEFSLVIAQTDENIAEEPADEGDPLEKVMALIAAGTPKKEALQMVAKENKIPKRELYNRLILAEEGEKE